MGKNFNRFFSALLACAMMLGTGCASSSNGSAARPRAEVLSMSSSAAAYDMGETGMVAREEAVADMSAAPGQAAGGIQAPSVQPQGEGRKIIWRVGMTLETLEFDSALDGITGAVEQAQGYIEGSNVSGSSMERSSYGESGRYASITARIPQDKLEDFLAAVGNECNVVNIDRSSEDITLQYTDVQARKRALEVEQERLMALLEKADTLEAVIGLEERLSEIRYQLDQYSSSLLRYDNLVDYSTVSMDIREVLRVTDPTPKTMGQRIQSGFSNTLYDIGSGSKNLVIWLVVNSPYLLIWAVLIAAVLLIVKKCRSKKARRGVPDSAPATPKDTGAPPASTNAYSEQDDPKA